MPSDTNETNIKLIWYYNNVLGRPEKKKIISRWRGYHGSGVMTGSLFWSISAASGLGALMLAHAWLIEMLRYAGAAYLLYLAYKAARDAMTPDAALPPVIPPSPPLTSTGAGIIATSFFWTSAAAASVYPLSAQ